MSCRAGAVIALIGVLGLATGCGHERHGEKTAGGPVVMRRLTESQYRNIARDVFGESITLGGRFEPDTRVDYLLAVGTGRASVTAAGLEQYDKIARIIGEQVVDLEHRSEFIDCAPAAPTAADDACATRFLSRIGRLLFRRPLTPGELSAYVESAHHASGRTNDFYKGLALALAGELEAPQFLYRQELSEPDPDNAGQRRLTAYSKAQRLSFLLWNTAPDPMLLAAAESGALHTKRGLQKEVDRLIASPRFEVGVRAFFSDMLEFDGFDALAKDAELYPKFTTAVAAQAQEQTLRTLVQLLVRDKGDYRDIFTTRRTFLTPLLASLYHVPIETPDGFPDSWVPYEFSDESHQSGIITQSGFVALHSHPGRSSPTVRGKALRETLLCITVPDPPGNVNFNLVNDTNNADFKTARQRLTAHATEPTCAGCHKIMDPIGLALENFDTIGGFRDQENGARLDTSGELDGVMYTDPVGLGKALHDSRQPTDCVVKRAYDYALGRHETRSEMLWRGRYLDESFAASGYRLPELFRKIATSETYYRIVTPVQHITPETRQTALVMPVHSQSAIEVVK